METIEQYQTETSPSKTNTLQFKGSAVELLGITLYNMVLTSLTLGLYYPWARVARLKFLYQNAYLNDTSFVFSGSGKELFKGFVKFFAFLIVAYASLFAAAFTQNPLLIKMVYFALVALFIFIIPLAIHGALRYRLSRTSWRGIHFGYRGDRGKLIADYVLGSILSAITLGIYQSWFTNNLRTYIIGNIRFGSIYFGYEGEGNELFWINVKGLILSILTLGLYFFWYKTEYLNYFANNTYLQQNENRYNLKADYSSSEFFGLMIVNLVLVLFTFGFGGPFAEVRTIKFILAHLTLPNEIDLNTIAQTEDEYKDATGDDVLDYLDIGIA